MQTIALLAHLVCDRGIWGPHLIIVPTSVLLNWECELKKWCPALKILTYFGSLKERKQKRIVSCLQMFPTYNRQVQQFAVKVYLHFVVCCKRLFALACWCCCRGGPSIMPFMFASLPTMWQSRTTEHSSKRSGYTSFWMRWWFNFIYRSINFHLETVRIVLFVYYHYVEVGIPISQHKCCTENAWTQINKLGVISNCIPHGFHIRFQLTLSIHLAISS